MTLESARPSWTVPATTPPYAGMATAPAAAAAYPVTIYGPPTPTYAPASPTQPQPSAPWAENVQRPVDDALLSHQARAFSIASMVIGISSIPLFSVPILAIMAVVFAFIGFRKEPAGRGMAIAGLVTGGVVIVLWIFFMLFLIVASILSPESLESVGTAT